MIAEQESMTAKLCSFARAYHSTMGKNKIFDDYLAYDIIGKDEYDRIGRLLQSDYAAEPYEPRYGFESVWVFDEMDRYFSPITLSRSLRRACSAPFRREPFGKPVCSAGGWNGYLCLPQHR